MFRLRSLRPAAALSLALGFFMTLPGCGGEPKPSQANTEKKGETPNPTPTPDQGKKDNPSTDTTPKVSPQPPPVEKVDTNVGVGKDAEKFMMAMRYGEARAAQLSMRFVKAIGLPAVLQEDKSKGYSPDAAEGWLKRNGSRHSVSPFHYSKQIGDAAIFRGMFGDGPGGYSLRMVLDSGTWKVDWLSFTSADLKNTQPNAASADAACQEFAATAVMGLLCDRDALAKEDRAMVLALGLTPALKAKWAEPLDSDKKEGFDYNRGLLAQKASEFAKDVDSLKLDPVPGATNFIVEVSRTSGAKSAYLVKLVKGPGSCDWLVDDVAERK